MDSIVIQNYEPGNHEDVKRIFASGQTDMIVTGIIIGWQKLTVIGYIFFCVFLDCYFHCTMVCWDLFLVCQFMLEVCIVFLQFMFGEI